MENGMENNGENSGPLTSLQVDRLTATDCNAAARAKTSKIKNGRQGAPKWPTGPGKGCNPRL